MCSSRVEAVQPSHSECLFSLGRDDFGELPISRRDTSERENKGMEFIQTVRRARKGKGWQRLEPVSPCPRLQESTSENAGVAILGGNHWERRVGEGGLQMHIFGRVGPMTSHGGGDGFGEDALGA